MVKVLTKELGLLEERENTKKQDETSKLQKHKLSSFLEDSEYSAPVSYTHLDVYKRQIVS